ncbi:MAG: cobyric acid synthase [Pseudomonadota bacterium]
MNNLAKAIMFLGSGSDVGKSVAAAAFCRILKRRGFKPAPFKAQNMSNNSFVTVEGGEIGRAQVVQAEACGLPPSSDMNPILLKPTSQMGAQIVLQGQVKGQMKAAEYHGRKKEFVGAVMESYHRLAGQFEIIVMEGAGSCCELNLKENDLVNFSMAQRVNAPCVLVADIDRGGVFAQTIGSFLLMTPAEKKMLAGFLINKFRGDPDLFVSGREIIEKKSGRPVFGVVPFFDHIHIDPEDSVAVQADRRSIAPTRPDRINAAVIHLPGISNFTDMEALEREPDVLVNYLARPQNLGEYDLVVLPGSKCTLDDAAWLARTGWVDPIREYARNKGRVVGICGGFQIMGREVTDPHGVESSLGRVDGLGLLPAATIMEGDKVLRRVVGTDLLTGRKISGYEIHMGRTVIDGEGGPFLRLHAPGDSRTWEDGWTLGEGRILGSYVHGLFDSPGWRLYFLNNIRREKFLPEKKKSAPSRGGRFHQYDLLADHYERHVDVDGILKLLGV